MKKISLALTLLLATSTCAFSYHWGNTFTIPDATITQLQSDDLVLTQTGTNSFSIEQKPEDCNEYYCESPNGIDTFTVSMIYQGAECSLTFSEQDEGWIMKITQSSCPGYEVGLLNEDHDIFDYTVDSEHHDDDPWG